MALASATSMIVSQAFIFLKLTPPSSLEDDSDKARDAALLYPVALRACIETCDWSFASNVVALPQRPSLPAQAIADTDLPYVYQLPSDFVTMQKVGDGSVRWRIDKAELLRADASGPLAIRYTAIVDQEAKLPAAFRMAVAAQLALYLAPRYAEATNHVEWLSAELDRELKYAQRADRVSASAQRVDGTEDSGWWADEVTR